MPKIHFSSFDQDRSLDPACTVFLFLNRPIVLQLLLRTRRVIPSLPDRSTNFTVGHGSFDTSSL